MDELPDLLADLTPDQRDAATHFEGPLLILAGAGSGKTRVITRRVAWLLQQGVRPSNILAITFTNKAAGEMRQRVEALVPGNRVWISTFHSFGARILRQYADRLGLDRNFTIYDQTDRGKLVALAIDDAGLDATRFTPDAISGAISKAKNQLLSPERYAERSRDFFGKTVAHVYPIYEKRLRDANALDFDDLLYWPALALKHDQDLRAELDSRFRFVLIDEYQDTNQAQYAIARGLSIDNPNLCVVGDPDQSIYGWRGSDIRNILDFETDFPNARVLTLSKNYRSTKAILRAAGRLIEHNKKRKPKDLFTDNASGAPVTHLTFDSGMQEAEGIARRIRQAVEAGRSYRDFAVFMRINALSRAIEQAFIRERVPFQIVKGLAFFDRKENRDVLAYLRLMVNPKDNISFLRVVNEPTRGVGKVSLEHLRDHAQPRELSLLSAAAEVNRIPAIKGKAAIGLRDFVELINDLRKELEAPPDQVIRDVLEKTGYRRALQESSDTDDQERLENIEELITAAKQFAAAEEGATIGDFLENITLASDVDSWDGRQDTVSVMTMHAAKGLEFPVVFMLAMEQGLLPHDRSIGRGDEVEEERRLAFVGMTRAKEELYLCHARMRDFRGNTNYTIPSMFLSELPEEVVEVDVSSSGSNPSFDDWRGGSAAAEEGWSATGLPRKPAPIVPRKLAATTTDDKGLAEGLVVRHATYGRGQIIELSGYGAMRRVKVRFATAGVRSFIVEKAQLEILSR
jgi:DNA helicase-2/ATP-dependent DNA helicase PcrA